MILVGIVIALQVLDAWSTWQVFRLKDGVEANPIVVFLIERLGLFWGLAVAKGAAVAIVAMGQFYGVWAGQTGTILIGAVAAFYAWVCWGNLRILYGNPRT